MIMKFPAGFFWGSATSAHQVEGGNINDWSEWEQKTAEMRKKSAESYNLPDYILNDFPDPFSKKNYISGKACDHYNRYEEDFDIVKSLGQNAHRFSLEWSRLEPKEGKFDAGEIEHYRRVIEALRERGIQPFVTLWHWTIPLWLRDKGGVEAKEFPYYFSRYAEYVVRELGDGVTFWVTLNEPTSVIGASYIRGIWPPQKRNLLSAFVASRHLALAHIKAYQGIHKINPGAKVGICHGMVFIESKNCSLLSRLAVRLAGFFINRYFLRLLGGCHDFIGLQYYFHYKIPFPFRTKNKNKIVSDMGWEIYPKGIYYLLKYLKKYGKPVYITENGLADAKDQKRGVFIKENLRWIYKAIQEGVDVRGYFYWSLLDNFEWDKGFWPRFGLVRIDYKTLKRELRPSAYAYRKIARMNGLTI